MAVDCGVLCFRLGVSAFNNFTRLFLKVFDTGKKRDSGFAFIYIPDNSRCGANLAQMVSLNILIFFLNELSFSDLAIDGLLRVFAQTFV
jgi:hypothetical protein